MVSLLIANIPVFVYLVGKGHLSLSDTVLVTYITAAMAGNSILALAGVFLLKPMSELLRSLAARPRII